MRSEPYSARLHRQGQVLDIVADAEFVGVGELSRTLDVSAGTIRGDLRALEAAGHVRRVWGGVQAVGDRRSPQRRSESASIAMAAALVRSKDTVLLAAEGPSSDIAAALVERHDLTELTIITGDVLVCHALAGHVDRFTVRVVGGTLSGSHLVATGATPDSAPPKDRVDLAFLPCHRIDRKGMVYLTHDQEAAASTARSITARRTVLVSTADVLAATGGNLWISVDEVDAVIMGHVEDRSASDHLRALGAQVLVAT